MTILGCTGHQNIPAVAVDFVADAIRQELARSDPADIVGVCSLAIGADQLFAASVLRAHGELHVVLPCRDYDSTFAENDLPRYESLLAAAVHVETLAHLEPSENAYLAAGHRVVDLADVLIAVWDGRPAAGKGGTADVVTYAHRTNTEVRIIWPEGLVRG